MHDDDGTRPDNRSDDTSAVTADDIVRSIEMILGRTPDQALVDYHLGLGFPDRFALGRYMLNTQEFRDRYVSGVATGDEPRDFWQAQAHAASIRRQRLEAFGAHARGVLARTQNGLFAVDPEDGYVAQSLMENGAYSSEELLFALKLVQPSSNVLVVGTHIGALAIPLARHCNQMVAVEANPRTFELLEANVRLSGSNNITLKNIVAGENDGSTVQFVLNRDNSGGSKIMPQLKAERDGYLYDDPEIVDLPVARIDTLLPSTAFDLILMDIEGSEVFALRGMTNILRSARVLGVEFRAHSLIEVAGLGIEDFIEVILPHFSWLFIPGQDVVDAQGIPQKLTELFDAGACYDAIYFFKEEPTHVA